MAFVTHWETDDASHTAPTLSAAFLPHLFQFSLPAWRRKCRAGDVNKHEAKIASCFCGVGESLSKWLAFAQKHPVYDESVSVLLRRKLKIWPERVSIFQQNWPFREVIKRHSSTFMAARPASGLRNEPHISRPPFLCIGKLLFCCMPF
jgi:hypothetical protein